MDSSFLKFAQRHACDRHRHVAKHTDFFELLRACGIRRSRTRHDAFVHRFRIQ